MCNLNSFRLVQAAATKAAQKAPDFFFYICNYLHLHFALLSRTLDIVFQRQVKLAANRFAAGALPETTWRCSSTGRSVDPFCPNENVLHAETGQRSTLFVSWRRHTFKRTASFHLQWPTALWSQPQIVYYLIDLVTEKKINQR